MITAVSSVSSRKRDVRVLMRGQSGLSPVLALNVVCCKIAIGLELGAKRKWLARAQNVADDPQRTYNCVTALERQSTPRASRLF